MQIGSVPDSATIYKRKDIFLLVLWNGFEKQECFFHLINLMVPHYNRGSDSYCRSLLLLNWFALSKTIANKAPFLNVSTWARTVKAIIVWLDSQFQNLEQMLSDTFRHIITNVSIFDRSDATNKLFWILHRILKVHAYLRIGFSMPLIRLCPYKHILEAIHWLTLIVSSIQPHLCRLLLFGFCRQQSFKLHL